MGSLSARKQDSSSRVQNSAKVIYVHFCSHSFGKISPAPLPSLSIYMYMYVCSDNIYIYIYICLCVHSNV